MSIARYEFYDNIGSMYELCSYYDGGFIMNELCSYISYMTFIMIPNRLDNSADFILPGDNSMLYFFPSVNLKTYTFWAARLK